MRSNFAILKASAAVAAIALAMPATSYAFDDVDWDWQKRVNERVDIDVDIDADIDLDSLTEVEKLQFHWGDVTATATVDYFANDAFRPIDPDAGPITETATVAGNILYEDDEAAESTENPITSETYLVLDNPNIEVTDNGIGGNVDEVNDEVDFEFLVTATLDPGDLEVGALDAADLPRIENTATAVGNNQLIESNSAVFLHDGQFVVGSVDNELNGDFNDDGLVEDAAAALASITGEDGNEHNELAGLLLLGGLAGAFEPAQITATATVGHDPCLEDCDVDAVAAILNASVDNTATAVANNASINVDGADQAGNTLIGDFTQFAYADVSATASVQDVLLDGYEGFGTAGLGGADPTPIISNVATAVGNNISISVGVPDVNGD